VIAGLLVLQGLMCSCAVLDTVLCTALRLLLTVSCVPAWFHLMIFMGRCAGCLLSLRIDLPYMAEYGTSLGTVKCQALLSPFLILALLCMRRARHVMK
jgi:hypothetical protein